MTIPIVFPDAAATTTTLLGDALGVETTTKVPNPRPDEFILVRRVGGTKRDQVIDDASLAIEAWSTTEAEAHDLLQLARAHLHASVGVSIDGQTIYRVQEFAGPASLPDPLSQTPRYTLTAAVTVKGEAISGS